MKNRIINLRFPALILLTVFIFSYGADAQNTKRKKTTKTTPVVEQPSVPTVVSRSDVYLDGNQIVLGEMPQQNQPTNEIVSPETNNQTVDTTNETEARIKELNDRIKTLESTNRNQYDEKQKRLLLNLDILTRAESRAESLRKQLFEMIEKENSIQTRIEQLSFNSRPEEIDRSLAFVGSMRPEELREQRKKSLEAESRNLQSLLVQVQTNRATLEDSVQKADFLVEKIRLKLDKEIDDALADDIEN